jgi:hypothetical protein
MRERCPELHARWTTEFNEYEVHTVILPQATRMGVKQTGGAGARPTPDVADPPTFDLIAPVAHNVRLPARGYETGLDR